MMLGHTTPEEQAQYWTSRRLELAEEERLKRQAQDLVVWRTKAQGEGRWSPQAEKEERQRLAALWPPLGVTR